MKNKLKEIIKDFPISPGVYQFIDNNGDILYVGKAKNLKSRIKSYFLKEIGRGPVIDIMMGSATRAKYISTESEIEAILLEAELIKKLNPKYNTRLRDDKSFLVIKITKPFQTKVKIRVQPKTIQKSESKMNFYNDRTMFPCVELVRYKNVDFSDKTAEYFGPYPSGLLLKKSVNYLRKIFPFRDCSKTKFATYRKKSRPCIYGDIRVCTAPCVDWVDEKRYHKDIFNLKRFLRGEKEKIYEDLKKEMSRLSKLKKYEEAALIRNQIGALDHLREVSIGLRDDVFDAGGAIFNRIECYDISNIGEKYVVGSMVVFTDGKKNTDEYRQFKIRSEEFDDQIQPRGDVNRLKQVLLRRFKNDWHKPDLIVIDGGELQLQVAKEVIKKYDLKIPIISISKGAKRDKNDFHHSSQAIAKYFLNNKNLQNMVISSRDEAHRFAISYYRKLHQKGMFE